MSNPLPVFERLSELLEQHQVEFAVRHHDPVFTCEEAAAVRGTPIESGAKALIIKAEGQFRMIVMPANRQLSSKSLRQRKIKNIRFASTDEVQELTGLTPGSIPPFGSLFGLETWCDGRLAENPTINFNAGDHGISIGLAYDDYIQVENPQLGEFSK